MKAKAVKPHLMQSFPPSCVNRDGNNSPKDCTFGDCRRARISGQCLKRAIRQAESFTETVEEETATRSKQMREKKLVPHLLKNGLNVDAVRTTHSTTVPRQDAESAGITKPKASEQSQPWIRKFSRKNKARHGRDRARLARIQRVPQLLTQS